MDYKELKEFLASNKTEKNKINSEAVDFLSQLRPIEFFCPICKKWHEWKSESLENLLHNNLPYYYMCNNKENSINITRKLSDFSSRTHEITFELELQVNNSSASIAISKFYLTSNILFFFNDKSFEKCIDFFAIKFNQEDIDDIFNIKKLYNKSNNLDFPDALIYLNPIEFNCPICGRNYIWQGETLSKYNFDKPYSYICTSTNSYIRLFLFKHSLCVIINQVPSDNDNNNPPKIYLVKSLDDFIESNEYKLDRNEDYDNTVCYKPYKNLKGEKYQLSFNFDKKDVEELKYHNYLNGLYKKNYDKIKLPFNPDIFKLVPVKYLCPICGNWHKFKTNYLFQDKCDFYQIYYEQICPNTNTIITIEKRFYEKYTYTIYAKNIYKYLDTDTICILNFEKDDILPRIYGTLYFNKLNGKTIFGLEFDELEFNKLVNQEPKYDITLYNDAAKQSYILATPYGIGTYDEKYAYVYDKVNRKVIHYKYYGNCENYLRLGNGTNEDIQKVPVLKSDLKIGDSVYYNEKLYFVHNVHKNTSKIRLQKKSEDSIIVIDPFTSDTLNITPYVSENGTNYYIKLIMLSDLPEYTLPKLWEKFK